MRRLLLVALLSLGTVMARPVAINGVLVSPRVETKTLPSGMEGLPVWFLQRLGVEVTNRPDVIQLRYAGRELRFAPGTGWSEKDLPVPELLSNSVHVPLQVLRALGLPVLNDAPETLDFAVPPVNAVPQPTPAPTLPPVTSPVVVTPPTTVTPPAPAPVLPPVAAPPAGPVVPIPVVPAPRAPLLPTPSPATPPSASPVLPPVVTPAVDAAQLTMVRASRTLRRAQETQRVVLEFSRHAPFQLTQDKRGLTLTVQGATAQPSTQKFESGDVLTLSPGAGNLHARLETGEGGDSRVFTLDNPYRIVIDTVTNLDPNVTPPPDLEKLPQGVTYRQHGKLHLLSFDPNHFTPKVVTSGVGATSSVYELVRRVGGVAGVNGGYFDPKTSFPVDLVAQGGLMLSPSLERRATLGFTAGSDILLGFPRPRYTLSGPWGALTVNTVRPQPNPNWVTLFVGDGRTTVSAPGYLTLIVNGMTVTRVQAGPNVPAAGEMAVTFDPARFAQLPRQAGEELRVALNWAAEGWEAVREALAAGPLLVEGGQYALDALREGFDTRTNVWRPTRQVAFAVYAGKPTIAYFENGTPEEFARALVGAGATRALRLDSGSSATVYFGGGYFNTVWSRPVPNAIVFVPKTLDVTVGSKRPDEPGQR